MHTVAYVFRRAKGMSLEQFYEHYEKVHGPLMAKLMEKHGLLSYEQYPTRSTDAGDSYVAVGGPEYDAVSIFTFATSEGAAAAWPIPEVVEDSERFIDFSSMVTLPVTHRRVFPR